MALIIQNTNSYFCFEMNSLLSNKSSDIPHQKGLLALMAVSIIVIGLFQGYWLRENFKKEKNNLEQNANLTFRETIRSLQGKKLKLGNYFADSSNNLRVKISETSTSANRHAMMGDEAAGYLNDIFILVNDSIKNRNQREETGRKRVIRFDSSTDQNGNKRRMVISMTNSVPATEIDSAKEFSYRSAGPPGEIVRFLYRVDSLQDSLRIAEIDSAVQKAFLNKGLNVSFSISSNDSIHLQKIRRNEIEQPDRITIGFAHPVTYQLNLGNTSMYLLKKLFSPILFSLFLVGVTMISFLLLYRNLMKQRRLSAIKNDFISNITHELKTPIATVGVAIEALRNFNAINDPQRTKEYLDISQNELQRLSLLVDKVLKLSMFEKKEIDLKFETVDLKSVIEEVISSMKLQIEKHHATVSLSSTGETNLQGDRLHLLSVVYNLLDNALKYGNGNTAVNIDLKEKENSIELVFADNGIGISPAYKDRVFEKFFRVPAGDTHNSKGYGLGLSYVAHVVQQHKGKISVESQPGQGAKFKITFPKQSV